MVVQAGEDGTEGIVVQRLPGQPVPASSAAAAAAPLRGETSAPAAARLHLSLPLRRASLLSPPAGSRPVHTVGL